MDHETPIYKVLDSELKQSHYHLREAFEALLKRIDMNRGLGGPDSDKKDLYQWHIKAAAELSTILLGIGEVERALAGRSIDVPLQDR